VFSTIKKYLDDDTITKLLLPKAKSLFTKSSAVRVRIDIANRTALVLETLDRHLYSPQSYNIKLLGLIRNVLEQLCIDSDVTGRLYCPTRVHFDAGDSRHV